MAACPACGSAVSGSDGACPACGHDLQAAGAPTRSAPAPARPPSGRKAGSSLHGRFASGQQIGNRFRIVNLLGRGGMGEVYRADDLKLDQPVALKFLPPEVERDPDRLERFLSEVRTARLVSHPSVCRVYDIGDVDGHHFLSMEYIDGEDLHSLLRRIGRLPEDKGIQIARQICGGLAAIHDRNILHRDLKPANVMIDGRGRARVTDFGLATLSNDREREVAGTVAYMSPEQLAGAPLTAQSDLYAVGLVLYELFTGERLHSAEPSSTARAAEREAAMSRLAIGSALLDPLVQRVIAKCLQPDPSLRPPSAMAIAAALPGGDPLAAAVAAGETPSPQLVAEAGDEGTLAPSIGVSALLVVVLGVAVSAWLSGQRQYFSVVDFPHAPPVLATKAREMLERLGYAGAPADTAHGFKRESGSYLRWLGESRPADWTHLADLNPPLVTFWYRSSPAGMAPKAFFGGTGGAVRVSELDPPLSTPGMSYIELTPDGKLTRLAVIPEERSSAATSADADWAAAFREAGLDIATFTPTASEWRPPMAVDSRMAWVAGGSTSPTVRVEAGSIQARVVSFRVIGPWTRPAESPLNPLSTGHDLAGNLLAVAIGIFTIALANRNIRLGRADNRGATILAAATGLLTLLGTVTGSHYGTALDGINTLVVVASWALFIGAMTWLGYIVVEPDVRRRRPELLIAWNRLLEGRWRDPLVGGALLIGTAIGVSRTIVIRARQVIVPQSFPVASLDAWPDPSAAISALLQDVTFGPMGAPVLIVLLIVLRILVRNEWVAATLATIVFVGLSLTSATGFQLSWMLLAIDFISMAILIWVAMRVGLVAAALTVMIPNVLSRMNVTYPLPDFLHSAALLGLIVVLAPAMFGFVTSRPRSKAVGSWLD